MEKIKVYSKENCVQCTATTKALGRAGLAFEVIMIDQDDEVREQLVDEGFLGAPVVDTGDDKWSGFRPDRIKNISDRFKA